MVEFPLRSPTRNVPRIEKIVYGCNFLLYSAMINNETVYTLER